MRPLQAIVRSSLFAPNGRGHSLTPPPLPSTKDQLHRRPGYELRYLVDDGPRVADGWR